MTDQKDASEPSNTSEAETAVEVTADEASARESDGSAAEEGSSAKPGASRGVAWLGLVLAVLGLGGVGWLVWQQINERSSEASAQRVEQLAEVVRGQADRLESQLGQSDQQAERVERLSRELAQLRSRLESRSGDSDDLTAELESLRESIEAQARTTESLANELAALDNRLETALDGFEQDMASLQARRDNRLGEALARAQYRMTLTEIGSLLRVARVSARAGGQPELVIDAYQQALDRARGLEDPRTERLREALARELEALQGLEPIDWAAMLGQLGGLEAQVSDWPLAGVAEAEAPSTAPLSDETTEADDSGWWSGVRRSLGGLVRVTPRDAAPLGPAAAESVRERIRLHLAGAQVAATRRQPEALEAHLTAVLSLIDAHFDRNARIVSQARAAIERSAGMRDAEWPELDASLAEIERQLDGS